MSEERPTHKAHYSQDAETVGEPFESVEEVWFWFVAANEAMRSGARIRAGKGDVVRPCEPVDIMRVLERLYRNRMLKIDHIRVLRHYGMRKSAPDASYVKEARASKIWDEAMDRLYPVLLRKKIVAPRQCQFMKWPKDLTEKALSRAVEVGKKGAEILHDAAQSSVSKTEDGFQNYHRNFSTIEGGIS